MHTQPFPDRTPRPTVDRAPSAVIKLMSAMARRRTMGAVMAATSPPLDRLVHRLSNGRATMFSSMLPTMMLVTTGRKSGLERRSPLLYLDEGAGGLIVVGSNFGRKAHPAWTANLLHEPRATAIVDGRPVPVEARPVPEAERNVLWQRLLRLWPAYTHYAEKAGRELRMFRLTPRTVELRFTREFPVPADKLWAYVGGFYSIADWQPFLSGSGRAGELRRECVAAATGDTFVEELADLGTEDDRFYSYRTVSGPRYVQDFRSTLRVRGLSADRSEIDWTSAFRPGDVPDETGKEIYTAFMTTGLDAVTAWAGDAVPVT